MTRFDDGKTGPITVLYVNDDRSFADLVRTKLSRCGEIDVETATAAERAMEKLATTEFDCVVTSYALPDGTGIDLLEQIQAEHDDLPTVLFTGRGSEEVASRATRADVSDYIPIRPNQESFELLARRIETLVDAARKRAAADRMTDRFRRTLERATDAIYAVDTDWRIEYMNEKMGKRVDRDPEEVVGNVLWEEFPSVVDTELEDRYRTAMETGESVSFEQYVGEPFEYWVDVRVFPDEDGLTVFSQEITDRKQQQREYQELAEEYDALLDTSGDAIFVLDVDMSGQDPEFTFAQLSPGYETQTGLSTDEVKDRTPRDVFGEERGAELAANYAECVEQREPIAYREELSVAPDARFWETSLAPVIVDDEIVRIVGIARNVTEQVQRERKLEQTNQRLEGLIEATPLTIMEIDADGEVIRWNEGAEEMFGWSREEVLGEFNPIIPEDQQTQFDAHRRAALNGKPIRGKEIQRETKEGRRLDLLLSVAPIEDSNGEVTSILAVLEDITEQKHLENRLRSLQRTAQQLSAAQSTEEIANIAVDAAVEILGFEITGIWEYDEREHALIPITETAEARELVGESPRFDPGNSLAWKAFDTGELQVFDDVREVDERYNEDTRIRSEIQVPLGDYGLISTGSPTTREFSETDVDLFRILGATVEAALARASREAELKRQNERLDQFASVVAHDLRNPLTVAMGFLEVAAETGDPDHFEKVETAHDRIERLIEDLLTLARGETTIEDREQIDLGAVAREAWGYVDTSEATMEVAEGVPVVAGDAGRLSQLFENLFRNAVEHGGKDVTITVGKRADGGFYVADDGEGIPLENRESVFDHGVTTNEGGTGFGLSIVEDIAKAHGWTVSVGESGEGGARFDFDTSR
ncbi:Signal transduction regulator [Halorhabdus sp. SVX81]|uniref:PAS domain S-box protein n=1 Tax=Halorhabdus sp. SVX81 TaxID=2978283 RepID=UPI0023DB8ABC|nr:PAS domain S-box protein [Halorhabdus sp. SVX81]WEL16239.1 Signal transduction regulator [Halorhabdus sp. SVX81]